MLNNGDDVIRNIPEQVAENTENIQFLLDSLPYDPTDYYNKTETDTLLAAKADSSDVYTKDEVDTALAAKADADDVYTKDEADAEMAKFYLHSVEMTDENNYTFKFKFVNKDPESISGQVGYFSKFANYMYKAIKYVYAEDHLQTPIGFTGLYYENPYVRILGISALSGDGEMFSINYQDRIESVTDTVTLLSNTDLI